MADLGELKATITADTSGFTTNLEKASDSVQKIGDDTQVAGTKVKAGMDIAAMAAGALKVAIAATAAAAAAAGAAMLKLTADGLQAADEQAKLARQLGFTNTELATLQRAAELSGVSMGTLNTSMRMLDTELGRALNGVDASRQKFESLGLSVEELSNMRPDERLHAIGAAVQTMGTHAEKTAAMNEIFGRSGQEMYRILGDTEGVLNRASSEVENFGLSLATVDSSRIEAVNDNMSTLGKFTEGLAMQMAGALSPALLGVTDKLVDMANDSEFMSKVVDVAMNVVRKALGAVGNAIQKSIIVLLNMELGWRKVQITALDALKKMDDGAFDFFRRFATGWQNTIDAMGILGGLVSGGAVGSAFRNMFSAADADEFRRNLDTSVSAAQSRIGDLEAQITGLANAQSFSDTVNGWFEEAEAQRAAREETEPEPIVNLVFGSPEENEDAANAIQATVARTADVVEKTQQQIVDMYMNAGSVMARNLTSIYSNLGQATEKDEEKLFKIRQNAAVAGAIIDGAQAAVSSYRVGAGIGGPVVGAAFAAASVAATASQIAAIRSQSFSSPSAPTSPSVSAPATSSAPQGQMFINVTGGDMFSGSQVRALIDRIAEAQNDGYRVVV